MLISAAPNAAEPAPKKHNARLRAASIWLFASTSQHDNAHRSWPIHRVFTGTTTTQESRHFVRGTEKSDQAGSLALTAQVRSGTVLLRSGSTEYQATRAVPHPANSSACSHHLKTTTTIPPTPHMPHNRPNPGLFSTATGVYALLPGGRLFFLW